jgi:hypothetical protein
MAYTSHHPTRPYGFYNHANNDFGFPLLSRGSYPSPRYSSTGNYSTRTGNTSPLGKIHSSERTYHYPPTRPSTAPHPSSSKESPPPKATKADTRKHQIPPGCSLDKWDPRESPIMLLGSVFDANSLGKWIYDWTKYRHGPATPISNMARELWLLLIQLARKTKRAEECMPRIRSEGSREMVEDFIESADRLMKRLKKLLKECETPMLKAGKRHGKEQSQLGKSAGIEFVDSIFGRGRQLEDTEKFIESMRLWNLRFDANCKDIVREDSKHEII